MTITPAQLEEWKRMASAATAGPWHDHGNYLSSRSSISMSAFHLDEMGQQNLHSPYQCIPFARSQDASFIAASRTALPALIAEVERLNALISATADWQREELNAITSPKDSTNE